MLQVARLAPRQLGESRDLVAAFLRQTMTPEGAFPDRGGVADLYYTVFGLEGLLALQEALPRERVRTFLARFGDGEGLDLVHLACLARAWASIDPTLQEAPRAGLLERLASYRSADGAFGPGAHADVGTIYASFLAFGACQDLCASVPDPGAIAALVSAARAQDGGYGNQRGDRHGLTTTTAAAVLLLHELGVPPEPHLAMWLLDRCRESGGFFATPSAPIPDLLSTATALHALAVLHAPIEGLLEPCLDFVDSLWTSRGGFYGNWTDDTLDVEYTYYGLLALGHLSLGTPA